MIQWLKRFYDSNGGCKSPDYDPEARRKGEMDFSFAEKVVVPKIYNSTNVEKEEKDESSSRPSTATTGKKVTPETKENVQTQPKTKDREERKEPLKNNTTTTSGKTNNNS